MNSDFRFEEENSQNKYYNSGISDQANNFFQSLDDNFNNPFDSQDQIKNSDKAEQISQKDYQSTQDEDQNENSEENNQNSERTNRGNNAIQKKSISKKKYEPLYDQNRVYIYEDDPEEYKKTRKRLQNRESASRVRTRKKNHTSTVEEQLKQKISENQQLQLKNAKLEAENNILKNQIQMLEKIVMNSNNTNGNHNGNNNANSKIQCRVNSDPFNAQQNENNSYSGNNNCNSSSNSSVMYETDEIFYSNQEQIENDTIIDPPFVRSSSNTSNFFGQNTQGYFLILFSIFCSFLILGEISGPISTKGNGDGLIQAIPIQNKIEDQEYHSIESDDENQPMSNRDLERLQNLWKKMKDSKQNLTLSEQSAIMKHQHSIEKSQCNTNSNFKKRNVSPGSIIRRGDSTQSRNQNYSANKYSDSKFDQEIQRSPQYQNLLLTNQKLQQSAQHNTSLVRKLEDANEEIDKCHEKIAELLKVNQNHMRQIDALQGEINARSGESKAQYQISEKQELDNQILNQRLQQKEDQLVNLQQGFQKIESDIDELQKENERLLMQNQTLQQNVDEKMQENYRIRNKLDEVENSINTVYQEKQIKGSILLEVEYLKSDIERLLTLLKTTKEFKDFAHFAQDSGKSIRYLNKMPNQIAQNHKSKKHHCTSKGNFEIIEKLLWVPLDAFEFLMGVKEKHAGNLSNECVEEILLGFNQIWLTRQNNQNLREKGKFESEIANLKKMLNKHMGYSEVCVKRQVSRLKQELSKVKQEKDDIQKKQNTNLIDPIVYKRGEHNYKFEKVDTQQQNIENLSTINNPNNDKMIYIEGAIWMAEKFLNEFDQYKNNISQALLSFSQQFESLIENNQFSQENMFQIYSPFVSIIDEEMENINNKLSMMIQSTVKSRRGMSAEEVL